MTGKRTRDPKSDHLLTPENSALVLIDYQPGLVNGVNSIERRLMINNVVALTKAAKMFGIPIILSTVGVNAGYQEDTIPELKALLPDVETIDRHTVNAMEDDAFVAVVEATGRRKLIMGALWTEICLPCA